PAAVPRTLSRAAAEAVFAYDWPLNIRELEQSLAAAVTVSVGEIGVEHLPRLVRDGGVVAVRGPGAERDRLVALIQKHGGNLSAVAREVSTWRAQLYPLLTRGGIPPAGRKETRSAPEARCAGPAPRRAAHLDPL